VLDLLAEGNSSFTLSEVAERSGVHRSTLHRRWPTRESLVEEALTLHTSAIEVPDLGAFADDMLALAHVLAEFFARPTEIAANRALAVHLDPEADRATINVWSSMTPELTRPFVRAIDRGEIAADTNPGVLLVLLTGPLVMCPVFMQAVPAPWYVDELALAVIRAAKPSPAVEARALELVGMRRVTIDGNWWMPLEGAAQQRRAG
jgi:AcrR family transcriptional regulator